MKNGSVKTLLAIALFAWASGMMLALPVQAQQDRGSFIDANYTKTEHRIPMRDGVELHTTVYHPKDQSQDYPIMLIAKRAGGIPVHQDIGSLMVKIVKVKIRDRCLWRGSHQSRMMLGQCGSRIKTRIGNSADSNFAVVTRHIG